MPRQPRAPDGGPHSPPRGEAGIYRPGGLQRTARPQILSFGVSSHPLMWHPLMPEPHAAVIADPSVVPAFSIYTTMHIRRALIWTISTISVFLTCDFICRLIVTRMIGTDSMEGIYGPVDHALRHCDDDILILGSSVAVYDLSAPGLEDSLGMKTFCAGAVGQSLDYHLTLLKAITAIHRPKVIILTLIVQNLDNPHKTSLKHNKYLRPYFGMGIEPIDSVLTDGDCIETTMLSLYSYRLNHIWTRIVLYSLFDDDKARKNGSYTQPVPEVFPNYGYLPDDIIMSDYIKNQLHTFADICNRNGIHLIVTLAPLCALPPAGIAELSAVKQCRQMSIADNFTFYDDTFLPPFDNDSTLYHDWLHLNVNGTKIYTDTLVARLSSIMPHCQDSRIHCH